MLYHLLLLISVIGATWVNSDLFVDTQIVPKQYWVEICLLLLLFVFSAERLANKSILHHKQKHGRKTQGIQMLATGIVLNASVQAVYGLIQFAGSAPEMLRLTGSFDNPAGFALCLCMSMPFALAIQSEKKAVKWLLGLDLLLNMTAVVLSGSRAGMISMAAMLSLHWLRKRTVPFWKKAGALAGILLLLLLGVYFIKKDSADGRLLIWRCSIEMIQDKPLFGYGPNGFRAHYMDYQADYLAKHPDSVFSPLADNVQQPFNEYLAIGINYGLAGILLLLSGFAFFLYCYRGKENIPSGHAAMLSLSGIGTFAVFSYPSMYALTWIIILLDAWILVRNKQLPFRLSRHTSMALGFCGLLCCLSFSARLTETLKAELQWKKAVLCSDSPVKNDWQSLYKVLEKPLRHNPYFLYNYSATLYSAGHYEESLAMARKCARYWSDYDLEMLTAQLYQKLKLYHLAEQSFIRTSQMCPNRFFPLYYRMCLYEEIGAKEKIESLARQIVDKPVKVPSRQIEEMKSRALDIISTNNKKTIQEK